MTGLLVPQCLPCCVHQAVGRVSKVERRGYQQGREAMLRAMMGDEVKLAQSSQVGAVMTRCGEHKDVNAMHE